MRTAIGYKLLNITNKRTLVSQYDGTVWKVGQWRHKVKQSGTPLACTGGGFHFFTGCPDVQHTWGGVRSLGRYALAIVEYDCEDCSIGAEGKGVSTSLRILHYVTFTQKSPYTSITEENAILAKQFQRVR